MITKNEYLQDAEGWDINSKLIPIVERAYSFELPAIIKRIVSHAEEPIFFEDGTHMLSYVEILDAEKTLGVAFSEKGLIPVADCYDGNYLVYDSGSCDWAMYSIIDDVLFKKRAMLSEVLLP